MQTDRERELNELNFAVRLGIARMQKELQVKSPSLSMTGYEYEYDYLLSLKENKGESDCT